MGSKAEMLANLLGQSVPNLEPQRHDFIPLLAGLARLAECPGITKPSTSAAAQPGQSA